MIGEQQQFEPVALIFGYRPTFQEARARLLVLPGNPMTSKNDYLREGASTMPPTISISALNELLVLLEQVRSKITDGSDMLWGWYETPGQLRSDLEQYVRQLAEADPSCLKEIRLLFLPTSVLQEHSIQNGWSKEYVALASDFDRLYDILCQG